MTYPEKNLSTLESQLSRFGELSRCLAYAPRKLVEQGFELMDSRFGGLGVPAETGVPEWLGFMVDECRWRLGSVTVGAVDSPRSYGVSKEPITLRLASVGLTYDEIRGGVQEPRVYDAIESTPWLWGHSQARSP